MIVSGEAYYYCDSDKLINDTGACYNNFWTTENSFYHEQSIVDRWILPSVGIFGIIGNLCGILNFGLNCYRDLVPKTYYKLMLALAFSDLILIITVLARSSFRWIIYPRDYLESWTLAYVEYLAYSAYKISQMNGIYLTISLSVERYFAICKPLTNRARKKSPYAYIIPIMIF